MTTYKVADGFNVALGSLNNVNPQPTSEGIKPTRRTHSVNGTVVDESKYVELVFNVLGRETTYQSLLNQFGIENALTNDVTVYVRDDKFTWVRMNGTAIKPEPGREMRWRSYFPRDVVILVRDLELST